MELVISCQSCGLHKSEGICLQPGRAGTGSSPTSRAAHPSSVPQSSEEESVTPPDVPLNSEAAQVE